MIKLFIFTFDKFSLTTFFNMLFQIHILCLNTAMQYQIQKESRHIYFTEKAQVFVGIQQLTGANKVFLFTDVIFLSDFLGSYSRDFDNLATTDLILLINEGKHIKT